MRKNNHTNILFFIIGLLILLIILNHNETNYHFNIYESSDEEELTEKINEPKRYYDSKYYNRGRMRINVPTRGEPPSYQQVGILTDADQPENIKPLYGRQTYPGSNLWNYFTSLDSHLATKIPIYSSDKDCTDEHGCKEIYKNDTLNVGDPGNEYKANIYNTIAPRYIPY